MGNPIACAGQRGAEANVECCGMALRPGDLAPSLALGNWWNHSRKPGPSASSSSSCGARLLAFLLSLLLASCG
jgi:hypothetical protein